jgi:hypothetical protein
MEDPKKPINPILERIILIILAIILMGIFITGDDVLNYGRTVSGNDEPFSLTDEGVLRISLINESPLVCINCNYTYYNMTGNYSFNVTGFNQTDNIYLYNESFMIRFNESKLNNTVNSLIASANISANVSGVAYMNTSNEGSINVTDDVCIDLGNCLSDMPPYYGSDETWINQIINTFTFNATKFTSEVNALIAAANISLNLTVNGSSDINQTWANAMYVLKSGDVMTGNLTTKNLTAERLIVGTDPVYTGDSRELVDITNNGDADFDLSAYSDSDSPSFHFIKAKGSTTTPTIVPFNQELGKFSALGYNGSEFLTGSYFTFAVNGTVGNSLPSSIKMGTNNTQALLIDSNQDAYFTRGIYGNLYGNWNGSSNYYTSAEAQNLFIDSSELASNNVSLMSWTNATYIKKAGDTTGAMTSDLNLDNNSLVISYDDNKVGIGTSSPVNKLHVYDSGDVRIEAESSTSGAAIFYMKNNNTAFHFETANSKLRFVETGLDYPFVINGNGGTVDINRNFTVDTNVLFVDKTANRVGINTGTPLYTLDVRGNINATGTGNFSDLFIGTSGVCSSTNGRCAAGSGINESFANTTYWNENGDTGLTGEYKGIYSLNISGADSIIQISDAEVAPSSNAKLWVQTSKNNGVFGEAADNGVYGYSAATGTYGLGATGVKGTGSTYGTYGECSYGGTAAVYGDGSSCTGTEAGLFNGNVNIANGALFLIDDKCAAGQVLTADTVTGEVNCVVDAGGTASTDINQTWANATYAKHTNLLSNFSSAWLSILNTSVFWSYINTLNNLTNYWNSTNTNAAISGNKTDVYAALTGNRTQVNAAIAANITFTNTNINNNITLVWANVMNKSLQVNGTSAQCYNGVYPNGTLILNTISAGADGTGGWTNSSTQTNTSLNVNIANNLTVSSGSKMCLDGLTCANYIWRNPATGATEIVG